MRASSTGNIVRRLLLPRCRASGGRLPSADVPRSSLSSLARPIRSRRLTVSKAECRSIGGSPVRQNLVPVVLESGAMGERSFDIYSRLLRERIICVHGEVTDTMASLVTAQLLFLESEAPESPLYMYINSPGGVVTAGMAMYDTMQYIHPEVHTICMGQAASMGSLLLAGGSPGCRFALPNARIMLHQPSGGARGMASDIQIQANEILRTRANLNQLYVQHTGQNLEDIERVMDRDTFMDAEQAVEFGVIDKILTKRPLGDGEEEDGKP